MITANTHFQPHWIPTLTVAVLIVVFVLLGGWQLERAADKQLLAERLAERQQRSPISITGVDFYGTDVEDLEFSRLQVTGEFLAAKTVLIENRKQAGKTGFHVITPLLIRDTGKWLLVNRGWVVAGPDLSVPDFPTPTGEIHLSGMVNLPAAPWLDLSPATAAGNTAEGLPSWPFFTLEHYRQWSGADVYPVLLLLSPQSPGGFSRLWPAPKADHSMHIGYALQWFGFAVIVLLIWIKLSIPGKDERGA